MRGYYSSSTVYRYVVSIVMLMANRCNSGSWRPQLMYGRLRAQLLNQLARPVKHFVAYFTLDDGMDSAETCRYTMQLSCYL